MPAATAWAELGMEPLVLQPKEGLALLNGTHVTSGIGGLALLGAERLVRVAEVATAMACEALGAIDGPFVPPYLRAGEAPAGPGGVHGVGEPPGAFVSAGGRGAAASERRRLATAAHSRAGQLLAALRSPLYRSAARLPDLGPGVDRDRDQLYQRQPALRRRVGHGPQWRELLRVPRRPGHGQPEDGGRERGGPGGSAVRPAGGREAQQRADAEPGGAASR
jgi:hypothetical protein